LPVADDRICLHSRRQLQTIADLMQGTTLRKGKGRAFAEGAVLR